MLCRQGVNLPRGNVDPLELLLGADDNLSFGQHFAENPERDLRFEIVAAIAGLHLRRSGAVGPCVIRENPVEEFTREAANRLNLADVGLVQPAAHHAADEVAGLDQHDLRTLSASGDGGHDAGRGPAENDHVVGTCVDSLCRPADRQGAGEGDGQSGAQA